MADTPNPIINENDLLVCVVRIDSRTKAMQEGIGEIKATLVSKADVATVSKLETRMDESEKRHARTEKMMNYMVGGFIVLEALIKMTR